MSLSQPSLSLSVSASVPRSSTAVITESSSPSSSVSFASMTEDTTGSVSTRETPSFSLSRASISVSSSGSSSLSVTMTGMTKSRHRVSNTTSGSVSLPTTSATLSVDVSKTYTGSADVSLSVSLIRTHSHTYTRDRTITKSKNSRTASLSTSSSSTPGSRTANVTVSESSSFGQGVTWSQSRTRPSFTVTVHHGSLTTSAALLPTESWTGTKDETPTATERPTRSEGASLSLSRGTQTLSVDATDSASFEQSASLPLTFSPTLTPPPTPTPTPTETITPSDTASLTLQPTRSSSLSKDQSQSLTVDPTKSMELLPTASAISTESPSASATVTRNSHEVTMTKTSSNPSATLSRDSTMTLSARATPSPTRTPPPTVTVSRTPQPTLSTSVTVSLSRSVGTPSGSFSNQVTASPRSQTASSDASRSLASLSLSRDITFSRTGTASVNRFTPGASYITAPFSSIDLLPVRTPIHVRFVNSPPYLPGDRAGLVPYSESCSAPLEDGGGPNAHMIAMVPTMRTTSALTPRPGNFTVPMVLDIGYYKVCVNQAIDAMVWLEVQSARQLTFGPRVMHFSQPVTPALFVAGPIHTVLPIAGGRFDDVIRLLPFGLPCTSAAPTQFAAVVAVGDIDLTVEFTAQLAGDFSICHQGFPLAVSSSAPAVGKMTIVGYAVDFNIHAPIPLGEGTTILAKTALNISFDGFGMTATDTFKLLEVRPPMTSSELPLSLNDDRCDESIAAQRTALYNDTVRKMTLSFANSRQVSSGVSSTEGLIYVEVVGTASYAGSFAVCYLYLGSASARRSHFVGMIDIVAPVATDVQPRGETYAAGSDMNLTFIGPALTPASDVAFIVPLAASCRDARSPATQGQSWNALTYDTSRKAWIASAPRQLGTYVACYSSAVAKPVRVSDAIFIVQERFYVHPPAPEVYGSLPSSFEVAVEVGKQTAVILSGYQLLATSAVAWTVSADATCSDNTPTVNDVSAYDPVASTSSWGLPPSTITSARILVVSWLRRGHFRLCVRTAILGSILTSAELFSVFPRPPSQLAPLQVAGDDGSVEFTVTGGLEVDLRRDAMVECTNPDRPLIAAALPRVDNASAAAALPSLQFNWLPIMAVRRIALCFRAQMYVRIRGATLPTTPVYATAQTSFGMPLEALPALRGSVWVPPVILFGEATTGSANGSFALQPQDSIVLCDTLASGPLSKQTRTTPFSWQVQPDQVGVYQTCFRSTATPALANTTRFGPPDRGLVVVPALDVIDPRILVSGRPALVALIAVRGSSVAYVTTVVFDPKQRSCRTIPSNASQGLLVFKVNSTADGAASAIVTITARGAQQVCYQTSLSGDVLLPFARTIDLSPVITSMSLLTANGTSTSAAVSDDGSVRRAAVAGCPTKILAVGSGVDMASGDRFFASLDEGCGLEVATMTLAYEQTLPPGVTEGVILTVVVPDADVTYYLCSALIGSPTAKKGSAVFAPPFSVTRTQVVTSDGATVSGFVIGAACVASGNNATYEYTVATSPDSVPLAIDDVTPQAAVTVSHLPQPIAYITLIIRDVSPVTGERQQHATKMAYPAALIAVAFCAAVPQGVSPRPPASKRKQFAEAYFIVYNFVSLSCATTAATPTSQRPTGAVGIINGLMATDPALLVDPASMLPTLVSAFASVENPVQVGSTLLQSTEGTILPYGDATDKTLEAHVAATMSILSMLQANANSLSADDHAQRQQLIIDRMFLVSSVLCAKGTSEISATSNVITAANVQGASATTSALVTLSSTSAVRMSMHALPPNGQGYCFVAIGMSGRSLGMASTAARSSQRRFGALAVVEATGTLAAETVTSFNLPLFILAVDPLSTRVPRPVMDVGAIVYIYSVAQVPAFSPYRPVVQLFSFTNTTGWQPIPPESITLTFDNAKRQVTMAIARPGGSEMKVSGVLSFAPADAAPAVDAVVDLPVVLITLASAFLFIVAAFAGFARDKVQDASSPADPLAFFSEHGGLRIWDAHRYTAVFSRRAHLPPGTMNRVGAMFGHIFVIAIASFVYAASHQAPGLMWAGVVGGVIVECVAVPVSSLVRLVLFRTRQDTVSYCCTGAAIVGGSIAAGVTKSFYITAAVVAGVGVVTFLLSGFFLRSHGWSLRPQPALGALETAAGWCLLLIVLGGMLGLGIYFGFVRLMAYEVRRSLVAPLTFIFALLADLLVVEPLKAVVTRAAALSSAQREAASDIDAELGRRRAESEEAHRARHEDAAMAAKVRKQQKKAAAAARTPTSVANSAMYDDIPDEDGEVSKLGSSFGEGGTGSDGESDFGPTVAATETGLTEDMGTVRAWDDDAEEAKPSTHDWRPREWQPNPRGGSPAVTRPVSSRFQVAVPTATASRPQPASSVEPQDDLSEEAEDAFSEVGGASDFDELGDHDDDALSEIGSDDAFGQSQAENGGALSELSLDDDAFKDDDEDSNDFRSVAAERTPRLPPTGTAKRR